MDIEKLDKLLRVSDWSDALALGSVVDGRPEAILQWARRFGQLCEDTPGNISFIPSNPWEEVLLPFVRRHDWSFIDQFRVALLSPLREAQVPEVKSKFNTTVLDMLVHSHTPVNQYDLALAWEDGWPRYAHPRLLPVPHSVDYLQWELQKHPEFLKEEVGDQTPSRGASVLALAAQAGTAIFAQALSSLPNPSRSKTARKRVSEVVGRALGSCIGANNEEGRRGIASIAQSKMPCDLSFIGAGALLVSLPRQMAEHGAIEGIKELLESNPIGTDLNEVINSSSLPRHLAALKNAGIELHKILTPKGDTLLHALAARSIHERKPLLTWCLACVPEAMNTPNAEGKTVLDAFVESPPFMTDNRMHESLAKVRALAMEFNSCQAPRASRSGPRL